MKPTKYDDQQNENITVGPFMDNPENLKTDKKSIYDMHEDMKYVDSIPLEDLKMEEREEKNHHETKHRSSSEDKYKNGMD